MNIRGIDIGSVPQWAMFFVAIAAFIRWVIPWRADELRKLRLELKECEEECRAEIKALHEEIFGYRKQNISEQLSLIDAIIRGSSPELRELMTSLETVQNRLQIHKKIQDRDEEDKL